MEVKPSRVQVKMVDSSGCKVQYELGGPRPIATSGDGGCCGCMVIIIAFMAFVAGIGLMCKAIHWCWT